MNLIKLVGYADLVDAHQIRYVGARGVYSIIHFEKSKPLLVSMSLKAVHQLVPDLLKIHRSYLVNRSCLGVYTARQNRRGSGFVQLLNGPSLPVSTSYSRLFATPRAYKKPVISLTTGAYFPMVSLAARAIGTHITNVSAVLHGRQHSVRAHQFRLATAEEQLAQAQLHF